MTQTIEQLTTRVRELEEENMALVKTIQRDTLTSLRQLAASQLHAEQLREALENRQWEDDLDETACPVGTQSCPHCDGNPKRGHDNGCAIGNALALPRDTSVLDAYVAAEVKAKDLLIDVMGKQVQEFSDLLNMKIATLTRQRDLAVEALERLEHSFDFGEIAGIEPEACGRSKKFITNTLSDIKESEAK